jgi:uncharacterized membrane protein YcaP (DUF421 family)
MLGLAEPYDAILRAMLLTSVAVLWTVLLVRVVGLRSFSKMTAFDFVTTIATGSLIAQAGTRSDPNAFAQAMAAIAAIFAIQFVLAKLRNKSDAFGRMISNEPVLLMENGEYLDEAMKATRVSRASIEEKLRAANVGSRSRVRAVVLETTGNVSVIHSDDVDEEMLEGVRRI